MPLLNIENAFQNDNRSIISYFHQPGVGFYIPLYQRDYSWDNDNIEQLLEDLSKGVQRISRNDLPKDKEIRFLGTIISVIENNRNNIYPVDVQAIPARVEKIIDGQQRLSTIALFATVLIKRLNEIKGKVKATSLVKQEIEEICDQWIADKLIHLISFDLGRGTPRQKPKIIRGSMDYWTRQGSDDDAYKSELSNYLAQFIRAYIDGTQLPCIPKKEGSNLIQKNGRRIESWLKKEVAVAHEGSTDEFVSAIEIISNVPQEDLWDFDRANLVELVNRQEFDEKRSDSYIIAELIQTLAVCHYLLDRCCFTIIQPTDDDWAFDMFQSLNATGTPLTAIETFKPTVVNTLDNAGNGSKFKDSESDKYYQKIEQFLSEAGTAQQKNKRTNDFLTSFFTAYDGRSISNHFSAQRKELENSYHILDNISDKERHIVRMGNYAEFYKCWLAINSEEQTFPKLAASPEADLASLLLNFLKASNHKMSITVLGTMYSNVLSETLEAKEDFIKTVKLIAAYYFIWRSTHGNSGLDTSYRDFFKNLVRDSKECTVETIKEHFVTELSKKGIVDFESWRNRAFLRLKYGAGIDPIVRLALLIASHDTCIDSANPGMIIPGRVGQATYLTLNQWLSPDLKTIEHVAPQNNNEGIWDSQLYDQLSTPYNMLGNLTLLPQSLNSSVGNKDWSTKLFYYRSVSETDIEKLNAIDDEALELGVELNESTLELLKNCGYNKHIEPISSLPVNFVWNYDFVAARTNNLLRIIWDKISPWIYNA